MSSRKILLVVLAVAAAISIAGSFAKDAIVRRLIVRTISGAGGFEIAIDKLHFGLLVPTLELSGVRILNPTNFPVRDAMVINRLFIRYDRASLFGKRGHVPEIDLDVERVVMIRRMDGSVNLEMLASVQSPAPKAATPVSQLPGAVAKAPSAPDDHRAQMPAAPVSQRAAKPRHDFQMPPLSIDRLRIKLGELDYYDYSLGAEPMVIPAKMDFDKTFTNVTNVMNIAEQLGGQLQIGDLMGGARGIPRQHPEGKNADHAVDQQIENVIKGL